MWPGGETGGTDIGNLLALLHVTTDLDALGETAQVHVGSGIDGVVTNLQEVASSAFIPFGDHRACSNASHGRTGGSGIIHSMMGSIPLQDGVETGVGKARGDAEEI